MPGGKSRSLGPVLRDLLPDRTYALLQRAGKLAKRTGVSAFVVGGFVRDLLLGRPNLDLDFVIEGDGIAYAKRLAERHSAAVKIFERFATAHVVFPDGFKLDVATARRENYAHPTALPTVEPSSLKEDLSRRDFTINALAIDLNAHRFGNVIDYYGGLRDLEKKTLRVLHDRSFVDDPTRLFRAIRFEQRFGFRIEANTMLLLTEAAATDLIHQLSGPRLQNEVMLLLAEKDPCRTMRRMGELDLLRFLHPRLTPAPHLEAIPAGLSTAIDWWTKRAPGRTLERPLVYFMALMDGLHASAVDVVLTRMALPNRQAEKIRIVKKRLASTLRILATRRSFTPSQTYRLFAGLPDEGLIMLAAKHGSKHVQSLLLAYVTTYQHVKPSLTGEDLKMMGLMPGPLYRKILDRLLDARLNGEVTSKADERAFVKTLAKA